MVTKRNCYAYIDGANLHKGVLALGWKLDYVRFRRWLRERHGVEQAYLFIGYVKTNEPLYAHLRHAGYAIVFKETTQDGLGNIKGNCDADLVLWAVLGAYEGHYRHAVIVSSDGDYAGLVKFLRERKRLKAIISPSDKCSILLMRTGAPVTFVRDIRPLVEMPQK